MEREGKMGFEGFILHPVADRDPQIRGDGRGQMERGGRWVDETICLMDKENTAVKGSKEKKKSTLNDFHINHHK